MDGQDIEWLVLAIILFVTIVVIFRFWR